MSLSEGLGYLASLLVFTTFYMKTMTALRALAIASNFAFIGYGFLEELHPVLFLHLALLPMNIHRLAQTRGECRRLQPKSRQAEVLSILKPGALWLRMEEEEILCRKGDDVDALYCVASGRVVLKEDNSLVEEGGMIGMAGLLSSDGAHVSTAVCDTECEIYELSRERVRKIVESEPDIVSAFSRVVMDEVNGSSERAARRASREAGIAEWPRDGTARAETGLYPRQQWMH